MATVKFYRGLLSAYNKTTHADGIYFATDKGDIIVNDVHYGMNQDSLTALNTAINNKIAKIEFVSPDTFKITNGNGNETVHTIPVATESASGLMSALDKIKLNGIAEGAQVNVLEGVQVDGTDLTITDKKVNIDLQSKLNALKSAYEAADSALKTELLGEVSDTDAKTIAALNDKIETIEGDAKTYEVVALTAEEIAALSDGTNVKEAYKVVDEDGVTAGEVIKVYKDSSLKSVELVDQELVFTYILADGTESTAKVDVSTFLAESEFGNGLVVDNLSGVVSVKVSEDTESAKYLTVDANGVKVSGIDKAISDAVATETAAREAADATHTANIATNAQGVADNKTAIEAEVTRATGVESGLRTDLGNTTDTADASGSAFARIAKLAADLSALVGGEGGSISDMIDSAIEELKGSTESYHTLAALEAALKAEVERATAAEEANAQAVTNAKNTIDAYTVNGKAISTNPVINGADVALTGYTGVTGGMVAETDTVNAAILKLDDALTWHEA